MNADLSIFNLILEASFAVQFVMLVLLVASIASWAIIFSKRKELDKATKIADEFEGLFWSGMDLSDLYRNLTSHGVEAEGIENVFIAGYREFSRLQQKVIVTVRLRWKMPSGLCGLSYLESWNCWMHGCHFWQRWGRPVLMSGCLERFGGL